MVANETVTGNADLAATAVAVSSWLIMIYFFGGGTAPDGLLSFANSS